MRSLPSDKVLVDVLRSMLEGSYIRRDLLELDNLVLAGDLTPHLVLTRLWLPTCRCLRLLYLVLQPTNIRVIHEHLKGSIPTPSLALVLPINSSFTDCFVRNHSLGMLTDQWPSQVLYLLIHPLPIVSSVTIVWECLPINGPVKFFVSMSL